MADFRIQINSIDGGIGPTYHLEQDNQYAGGIAIDPEAVSRPATLIGGAIVPIRSQKFTAGKISAAPMWLVAPGKDTNLYTYCADGSVLSYSNTLGSETVVSATIAGGSGNGASYYNDYLYFATSADVYRYGPLDNAPSMTASAWTGNMAQQRLSAVASYPAIRNMTYPNHPMHVHNDGKLYFADYVSASTRPCLNWISSLGDGTLPGGLRRALDLPYGYMITDIESFGPDLAILCMPQGQYGSGAILKTGKSALFLWDTFSQVPYRQLDIPDPIATALLNQNGQLRIWSGQLGSYVRVFGYTGANSFIPMDFINEGSPPPAGAVDTIGDMLAWGSYGAYPSNFTGVTTLGYRSSRLSPLSRNVISQITGQGSTNSGIVTSLSFLATGSTGLKYPLTGWLTDTPDQGIDQTGGSGAFNSTWRSKVFNMGQEFEIRRIRIPLGNTLQTGTQLTVKIFVDNESTSFTANTVNPTNYPGNPLLVDIKQTAKGNTNFLIEIVFSGTVMAPVVFPITIDGVTLRDNG